VQSRPLRASASPTTVSYGAHVKAKSHDGSATLDTSDRQLVIAGYDEAVERRCFAALADDSFDDNV
jgi:hypothetical protein